MFDGSHFVVSNSASALDPITALGLILAALGVLLTALAIIIGIAAIWGYRGIADEARKIASDAADKKLAEYFENESLKDKIRLMMAAPTHVVATVQSGTGDTGQEEDDHDSDTGG